MEHRVTAAEAGRRVKDILRGVMGVSYSAMKSAKWDGRITVDGTPVAVDTVLREGQTVAMRWKDITPAYAVKPYPLGLNIPYADEHLLIIDKPAPLASQSSANHPDDALENALFAHFGCPEDFVYRPVNRLDKGTSGLMVVARTPHSQHRLQSLLHTDGFNRVYLAVVEGHLPQHQGVINAPIGKEDAASIRRIITGSGKPSVTHYEVLEETATRSLVRLQLKTGRTHQIRVHMRHMGCPVCGDFLYGSELDELPGRFALHSHELHLLHPLTGKALHIISPLPDALRVLLG
ncbi:MAG: RluA family pseudouridine synthase [Clostridia bacterium]|nr:RluA family pseudouridine synthase [Clostridia bacterium]